MKLGFVKGMLLPSILCVWTVGFLPGATAQNQVPSIPADTIYFGGPVLTMNDQQPTAQAVTVRGGRIISVGTKTNLLKQKGPRTKLVDLKGKTLLPGFIDAHSHVSTVGLQAISANLLPPPDGPNSSIAALQDTLRDFRKESPNPRKFGLLLGFGYDDSQLKEQRHPTRDDLDAVATDLPIVLMHQSGHLGALNSKALELAGYTAATKDPEGGVIRRRPGSDEPNGVLEEAAFFTALMKLMPRMSEDEAIGMMEAGQELYLRYGYTTIQDGRSSPEQVLLSQVAASRGRFKADIVSYPDITLKGTPDLMKAPWFQDTTHAPRYRGHFRIGGVKMTLDGSPQGKTAWLSKPYFKPPEGLEPTYAGYGVLEDAFVVDAYEQALRNRWQIITHANGDRAIDQMLDGIEKAEKAVPEVDVRPVLIHGQTLRRDQVLRLKKLGVFPSLFPMHTYYWGDWHRTSVLGPQRAENISPTGWVLEQGMRFTSHHDAPVAFPDSIRVLDATVNRTTRSGYVLGPRQRVSPLVALKALTLWAAYQHFEEKTKGSIEVGKFADFVILSDNPLTMPRNKLITLKVLETIKEDETIYKR